MVWVRWLVQKVAEVELRARAGLGVHPRSEGPWLAMTMGEEERGARVCSLSSDAGNEAS